MKAVVLEKHGGLDELKVVKDFPDPEVIEGHVVIRVGAGESHAMITSAEALRDYFVKSGARVDYHAYPEQQSHTLPASQSASDVHP